LLDLQWSDIDFERKFIRLRADAAKNERTEKIPMSAAAEAIPERVEHTSTYIFPGRHGEKRKEFSRIARRVRDKAGLPKDFRPLHALRQPSRPGRLPPVKLTFTRCKNF
jgi:integrase